MKMREIENVVSPSGRPIGTYCEIQCVLSMLWAAHEPRSVLS